MYVVLQRSITWFDVCTVFNVACCSLLRTFTCRKVVVPIISRYEMALFVNN